MESFKGPLGSHTNYINYIVIPNLIDYFNLQEKNKEQRNIETPHKYEEMRVYLNAIESFNNILEYFYYENEESLKTHGLKKYKENVAARNPIFLEVANIANAYKHCVREHKSIKNTKVAWAKDLQNPRLEVEINIPKIEKIRVKEDIEVNVTYSFEWPISSHEKTISEAFRFLVSYSNSHGANFNYI
ncbi:MAG: hypothetical protein AAGC78_13870 [Cellvibrio sp.]|uniref:hypothetical protein n=1 Tax=Cellvibrio sp. TaxID=1965322 RepID=UPI0031B1610E